MGADQHLDWQAAASALDWWVAAGVDVLVEEEARDWLAPPAPLVSPPEPVAAPGAMPGEWTAYATWRSGPEAVEHRWPGQWVVASGPAAARLMVLSDCPDHDDVSAGSLLAGEAGRLFDRMLAAIGLARGDIHLASVCAKRPTGGRVPPQEAGQLAALARHHVGLVAPRALLVVGNAASRAILATDAAAARGRSHSFNHSDREMPVVASYHPRHLLERPALKAGAWADLRALKRLLGD
jgi:DNA polymerase